MHLKCSLTKHSVARAMKRTPAVLDAMTPTWEVANNCKAMSSIQQILLFVLNQIFQNTYFRKILETLLFVALEREISRAIYKDAESFMKFC